VRHYPSYGIIIARYSPSRGIAIVRYCHRAALSIVRYHHRAVFSIAWHRHCAASSSCGIIHCTVLSSRDILHRAASSSCGIIHQQTTRYFTSKPLAGILSKANERMRPSRQCTRDSCKEHDILARGVFRRHAGVLDLHLGVTTEASCVEIRCAHASSLGAQHAWTRSRCV
jgi:hypothetical protein